MSSNCQSRVWALLPFAELVVADVLLYAAALFLEFAALVALRIREPELRGAFRLPFGTKGVAALTLLPIAVMFAIVGLAFHDGEVAMPALFGSIGAAALGPFLYLLATRLRPDARLSSRAGARRRKEQR